MLKVEAWAVLKKRDSSWDSYPKGHPYEGQTKIESVRITRVTAGRPSVADDEIAVKLVLDVDEGWFLDAPITVNIPIPAPPPSSNHVTAQVDIPVRGRAKTAAAAVIQHP